jgi:hypothetical protein
MCLKKLIYVGAIAAIAIVPTPSMADWIWWLKEHQTSDDDLKRAAEWINSTCKPDRFQEKSLGSSAHRDVSFRFWQVS